MKMFDPQRPSVSSEQKALLLEGSAIPQISLSFLGETVKLSVMVRDFSDTKNRTYVYRHYFCPLTTVELVLRHYLEDPELALATYFNWLDAKPGQYLAVRPTAKQQVQIPVSEDIFDLL